MPMQGRLELDRGRGATFGADAKVEGVVKERMNLITLFFPDDVQRAEGSKLAKA